MEILKLIGVVVVIIGFMLKFDAMATVVVAGLVTGLVAGLSPMSILDILGSAFITNRTATLFVLTLPVIALCERNGLKDKAVDLIKKLKNATSGRLASVYLIIRAVAASFSLRIGGHPQFVRPLINPMAQGAAIAKYGEIDEQTEDEIKGLCAANENYGNFFAQNCFMGASGTLMIVTTLSDQGFEVNALQIASQSVLIAVCAVLAGICFNLMHDAKLNRRFSGKKTKEADKV